MSKKGKNIVLGVCGSIAAYKAADIIRRLRQENCSVTVVMTKEAEQFITPLTLATLSGKEVYGEMFATDNWRMGHIELACNTDVLLIAPVTANMIAKIAHGFADDLLSALVLTIQSPVVLAPAMNEDMYNNPATKDNCAVLKKRGLRFIDPIKGNLACNVVGMGHLAETEAIVKVVLKI